MKSISGNLTSSKPISLAKSAKYLSKFVAINNEASYSVQAYLRRTSTAFSELVQVHKDIKALNSGWVPDESNLSTEIVRDEKKLKKGKQKVEEFDAKEEEDEKLRKEIDDLGVEETEKKRKKKRKKNEGEGDELGLDSAEKSDLKKKKKKKRKTEA